MTETDTNLDNYAITLQDRDGITLSGTNYKINSGVKFALEETGFQMSLPTKVSVRSRSNRELTNTVGYTTLLLILIDLS